MFITCPACAGRGEIAVPGTYGGTISPEDLRTTECTECSGEGSIAVSENVAYDMDVEADAGGWDVHIEHVLRAWV